MRRRPLTIASLLGLALASSAGAGSYTIRPGDSLSLVAKRLGTTVSALAKANGITDPDRVKVGQILKRTPVPSVASAPAPPSTYIIKKGDSLSVVAKRLGVTVDVLAKANKITNVDKITLGQALTIPGVPVALGTAPPVASLPLKPIVAVKAPAQVVEPGLAPTYVVQAGDSAKKLAARFKTSVATLRKLNPDGSLDHLTAGAVLTLPGNPVWICPVQGKVSFTDTWGAPRPGGKTHQGTDMMAARGTPVVANLGGSLEPRTGPVGGIAYYLHADDGNSYYGAHLDALTAAAGRIAAGQQIGVVGDTGDAKGGATHLHFELKPGGGDPVDSFPTLDKWC